MYMRASGFHTGMLSTSESSLATVPRSPGTLTAVKPDVLTVEEARSFGPFDKGVVCCSPCIIRVSRI
jgi:hypothetical protein